MKIAQCILIAILMIPSAMAFERPQSPTLKSKNGNILGRVVGESIIDGQTIGTVGAKYEISRQQIENENIRMRSKLKKLESQLISAQSQLAASAKQCVSPSKVSGIVQNALNEAYLESTIYNLAEYTVLLETDNNTMKFMLSELRLSAEAELDNEHVDYESILDEIIKEYRAYILEATQQPTSSN